MAFPIIGVFEQNIDDFTNLYRYVSIGIDELRNGYDTFRLVSDIDNDIRIGDLQNRTLHHFAFGEFPGTILI